MESWRKFRAVVHRTQFVSVTYMLLLPSTGIAATSLVGPGAVLEDSALRKGFAATLFSSISRAHMTCNVCKRQGPYIFMFLCCQLSKWDYIRSGFRVKSLAFRGYVYSNKPDMVTAVRQNVLPFWVWNNRLITSPSSLVIDTAFMMPCHCYS